MVAVVFPLDECLLISAQEVQSAGVVLQGSTPRYTHSGIRQARQSGFCVEAFDRTASTGGYSYRQSRTAKKKTPTHMVPRCLNREPEKQPAQCSVKVPDGSASARFLAPLVLVEKLGGCVRCGKDHPRCDGLMAPK